MLYFTANAGNSIQKTDDIWYDTVYEKRHSSGNAPGDIPAIPRAGVDFYGSSTAASEERETVDGVSYYVIPVEVSSASHSFYTGKEHVVDAADAWRKFRSRIGRKASKGKKRRSVAVKKRGEKRR